MSDDSGAHGTLPRIRIAIVGLNFGRHIVDQLTQDPARQIMEIVAVCDLDRDRVTQMGTLLGVPSYQDIDALLNDPKIQAIGLFTGPVGRAELISRIIRAGKHVMTTKPFEVEPARGLAVLNEAARLGRVVHLNSPSPLEPEDLRQVRLWQKSLKLGRPVGCRADVWASYREKADGGWYDDPKRCPVAPIFRLGIYLINDLVRLMGEVESAQVMHSRLFTGRPTPDNAQLALKFRSGALACVYASFCVNDTQHYSNSMTVNFENGTIYRNVGPRAEGLKSDTVTMSVVAMTPPEKRVVEHAEFAVHNGAYQWEAFRQAVLGTPLEGAITSSQVVEGIKVIAAMARSEQSGRAEAV